MAGRCGAGRRSRGGDGVSETVASQWRIAYVTTGKNAAAAYRVCFGSGGRWQPERSGEENIIKTCLCGAVRPSPAVDHSSAITTVAAAAALLFCGAREPPTS